MKPTVAAAVIFIVIALSLFAAFALPSIHLYSYSASGKREISASGINSIDINDPAGSVDITAWNGSQLIVSYVSTSNIFRPVIPEINVNNGALNINVGPEYISFGYSVYISVKVPSSMVPQIYAELDAGNIMVQMPYSGSVYLATTTGNINVNISDLPQATVKATTGNIVLVTEKANNVYASTTTGDISANLNGPLFGNYVFLATTGNINVLIPANSSLSFSISSASGSIGVSGIPYNMIENQNQLIRGMAGTGLATLSESTTTGNAFLKAN